MDKSLKISSAAALSAVAAALMLCIPSAVTANAENESATAELSPVYAVPDIAYAFFDAPSAVHAEASGIYVTCADGVVSITVENATGTTVSEPKNIAADKAYKYGDCYIALYDGALSSYYGSETANAEYSDKYFVDFDISGDTLYAVSNDALAIIPIEENGLDTSAAKTVTLTASRYKDVKVSYVAALSDKVFVALASSSVPHKNDIAYVDAKTGALSTVLYQSDEIMALTAMAHSDTVYALTRDKITGYTASDGAFKQKYVSFDARMTDIYAYDGFLYALDTLGALYRLSDNLTAFDTISASASSTDGFFNSPSGVAVKNSTLYVADSVNNRIAMYGSELSYIKDKYNSPVSVACDSRGTLYVAHDFNKVSIGADTEFTVDGYIRQIVVNADKHVFILSDGGLWTYDGTVGKISDTPYKAITLGVGRDELYALADDSVQKITAGADGKYASSLYCAAPETAISLSVDFKGNVFILNGDSITRVDKEYGSGNTKTVPLAKGGKPYAVLGEGHIALSTIDNGFVNYGDVIVVDTFKHAVFSVDGSAEGLNVKLIDGDDYEDDHLVNDRTPANYGDGLIRTALYDVPMFSLPIETPAVYVIKAGRKVIVPEYNLDDTREYSLVLIDDTENHKLVQGYVYKDALSDALEYAPPPADKLSPYSGATPIYKWPSPHAKTVDGYSPAVAGTNISAIDFVEAYRDYRNNLWYRVRIGENFEGFMMAADVVLGEYEVTTIRPAYNAKIISYKSSKFAQTYVLKDGNYVPIDITLNTGTKVEVVDAFDTSKHYTKIKCLTDVGTVTCYVETVYIEYEGVNIVLLVAIVVIIITVVLAAVIIARVFYLKKRRLTHPEDEDDRE
ncbi:MAG: hypothetical protein J1G38_07180 [Clostridiales bacterium]|nr:hypothetical protein [Clostridiales bacterium]